jgi:hypothetical protein
MRRGRRRSRSHSASEVAEDQKTVAYRQPQPEEGVQLGCAMLTKIRYRVPDPTARVPLRCALGYAIRTEEDVARCLAVPGPSECWRGETNWRVYPLQVSANGHGSASTSDVQDVQADPEKPQSAA